MKIDVKKDLLNQSEISIILDTYDDIFSDFDPRPYNIRIFSDDFLKEVKKELLDKITDKLELKLMIPAKQVNTEYETVIIKRLKDYFKDHLTEIQQLIKNIRLKGVWFLLTGITLMFIGTYITYHFGEKFFTQLIRMALEPAGWFSLWNGMDQIIFTPNKEKPMYEFYKKMTESQISFIIY